MAEAWLRAIEETPWHSYTGFLREMEGVHISYRDRLDRPPRNYYGELIPQIVIVRAHIRKLGNIRLDPARLP